MSEPAAQTTFTHGSASHPPLIAMVSRLYAPHHAGAECQIQLLARCLSRTLGGCAVITTRFKAGLPPRSRQDGVEIRRLPSFHGWRLRSLEALVSLAFLACRRRPYRVVHLHCLSAFTLGALLGAKLRGAATILTVCTTEPEGEIQKIRRHFAGPLLWWIFRKADVVLALTPAMISHLRSHGVADAKIHLLPNMVGVGIDPPPAAVLRRRAREALGLPDGLVVLYAGRLTPGKGLDRLLEAWPLVVRRQRATLLLVGEGPLEPLIRRYREESGEAGASVFQMGWQPTLDEVYRAADVFVFLSDGESFGNVLAEAMMFGIPVVTTPVGLARDWIQDGENGLVLPMAPAPEVIAEAICRVLADEPLRNRVGREARRRALTLFTPQHVLGTYLGLCRLEVKTTAAGPQDPEELDARIGAGV